MKIAMPPEEAAALKRYIKSAKGILEYGSGGSTVYGSKSNADFIVTVDNDKEFLDKVRESYGNTPTSPELITVHSYIGPSKLWGYPVDKSHQHLWKNYPQDIWNKAKELNLSPDTIIIDGRFRVACFLYSISQAEDGTIIFWDDYVNRDSYHIVETILRPQITIGRAAVFVVKNQELDQELFDKYCNDVR